jgi:hypothetical protein
MAEALAATLLFPKPLQLPSDVCGRWSQPKDLAQLHLSEGRFRGECAKPQ